MAWLGKEKQTFNKGKSVAGLQWNSLKSEIQNKRGALKNVFEENKEVVMDQETIESLYSKKEKVLDYLKTNCFDKKEWVEEYWEKWTHYSLVLPSVKWFEWNWFKCKKIDWFVSDRYVTKKEYRWNGHRRANSSYAKEISSDILWNMRSFLKELGVLEDVGMNFVRELFSEDILCEDDMFWEDGPDIVTGTWNSVKNVTGLNDTYWLRDTRWNWSIQWCCFSNAFEFNRYYDDDFTKTAKLCLWLNVRELG